MRETRTNAWSMVLLAMFIVPIGTAQPLDSITAPEAEEDALSDQTIDRSLFGTPILEQQAQRRPLPIEGVDDPPVPPTCTYEVPWYGHLGSSSCESIETCSKYKLLNIKVRSYDDPDNGAATVHGGWDCGGAYVGCDAKSECQDQSSDYTTESGSGTCSGSADETWASDLEVTCWESDYTDPPCTVDCYVPKQYCPVTLGPGYPKVCVNRPEAIENVCESYGVGLNLEMNNRFVTIQDGCWVEVDLSSATVGIGYFKHLRQITESEGIKIECVDHLCSIGPANVITEAGVTRIE